MIILAFILTTASSVFGILLLLLNPDLITGLVQSISLTNIDRQLRILNRDLSPILLRCLRPRTKIQTAAKKPPGANASAF